jgi:class 3 adenylate cyclase/tetratricopeptide (TPR) repeat protein
MSGPEDAPPIPASAAAGAGTRRDAAVMFADLSGFTEMSERLDPELVVDLINRCFAALEAIVHDTGGEVEQYIGDCVAAVWDLAGDGAARAVRAAQAMRETVTRLNAAIGPPAPLDVHIGIASGAVIAGRLGGAHLDECVVGEPVAVAQRLGEAGGRGEVWTDAATHAAAGRGPHWRSLEPVTIKNRSEPVEAFALDPATDAEIDALVDAAVAHSAEPLTPAEIGADRERRDSERRHATIVFAEVLGLEPLAHVLSPERFIELLNRCCATLEPAVQRYGGAVDKFVGPTLMALFGVPTAIEHAPRQALNAAIELRQALRQFAAEQGLTGQLDLRVGINSGLIVAGDLGGRATRAFTVVGDAVNVAARLKEAAPAGATWLGRDTHRAIREAFVCGELPPLALKGKGEPVPVWRLDSEHEQLARVTTGDGIHSSLVGREREIAAITTAVDRLASGIGGIVAVVGEAGIGKSRLMAEAMALPGLRRVRMLEGRALSIGQRLSFHPFADLLRRWAGIDSRDVPAAAAAKLAAAVRALAPNDFDDLLPFVARLIGLRVGGAAAERTRLLEGEAMEELLFKAMRDLLGRLAEQRPLMLVFEDVHWADQSSIKLLEALLRLVVNRPVLFVLAGRPDFADTLVRVVGAARDAHALALVELSLQRLTDQECDALICNLLRTDELPYELRALITRKAEGNPFYIEEVLRSLLDTEVIVEQDGRKQLTRSVDSVEVPDTIAEVVLSRVDRLDEFTRHVLQVASVIGRTFFARVLRDVMDAPPALDDELAGLQAKQLLRQGRTHGSSSVRRHSLRVEIEYLFTHALAHEAVYGSLLQRTRKELHQRVARSIETLFADRLVDVYGMLAYHYSRADELAKAEEYLFKAGEEAARSAASAEALTFFRDASQLYLRMHGGGGDPGKKALLEKNIALALLNTGALTESIAHFDRAAAWLGKREPRTRAGAMARFGFNITALLAQLYLGVGRRRHIADLAREQELCDIWFNRGRAEITSDPTRLFFDTVAAFRYFNEIDATRIDQASAMYASAAGVFCYSGVSFAVGRRALEAAERLIRPGVMRDEFPVRSMQFVAPYLAGEWRTAPVIDAERVELALRQGLLWDVNTYVGLYADLLLRQGRFDAAGVEIDRLAEINDAYGYGFAGTNRDAMVMLLLIEQRRLPEALEAAEHYQRARHEVALKVLGLGSKAKVQTLLGDHAGAAATLAAAERFTARTREVPPWHLSAYAAARLRLDLAVLQAAPGSSSARRRARRSATHAAAVAAKAALQRTEILQLCGALEWTLGRSRQALDRWADSLATGVRMQARPERARTQALLASALGSGAPEVGGLRADAHGSAALAEFEALGLGWDLEALGRAAGAAPPASAAAAGQSSAR